MDGIVRLVMRIADIWGLPPADPVLGEADVHAWLAALDPAVDELANLRESLSPDERERADRFKFEKDRTHFIAARGYLRRTLGHYLDVEPRELRFTYNRYGKPSLDSDFGQARIEFNVAHSHGIGLYGFTRGRAVGVDVERVRPEFATEEIAARFFARAEQETLASLSQDSRATAFFDCWTRKEAFIKALGKGLSFGLSDFVVAFGPGKEARLLSLKDDPDAGECWEIRDLPIGAGYAGAIAVQGCGLEIKTWRCAEV